MDARPAEVIEGSEERLEEDEAGAGRHRALGFELEIRDLPELPAGVCFAGLHLE